MGKNKDDGNQGDEALWAHVARTVKPLPKGDDEPSPHVPSKRPRRTREKPQIPVNPPSDMSNAVPPRQAGLDRRTAMRLRRGQMPIDATLDLHGARAAEAPLILKKFLIRQQAAGARCVLVITGKGRTMTESGDGDAPERPGILRRSLPGWLDEPPLSGIVLRHTPAKGRHGGQGAFYILLRRVR